MKALRAEAETSGANRFTRLANRMRRSVSNDGSADHRRLWLVVILVALGISMVVSLTVGTAQIGIAEAAKAFYAYDDSFEHIVVRDLRFPRAVVAAAVGGALAVSGALMQGITRNPLASPGLLGVNAGAALAVIGAIHFLGITSLAAYAWFAFAGAGAAAVIVYTLGSSGKGRQSPVTLALAGASVTALLSSLITAVLIFDQQTLDQIRFWLAGSVADKGFPLLSQVAPYMATGLLGAILLSRQITTLSLGEDIARGLGQRTALTKISAGIAVVLLAGSAVAITGPIGFVGLVVPHVARFLVGHDYRWIILYSAVLGSVLTVTADIAARMVIRPEELPIGVMTAVVGAPFFIYLVRTKADAR